MSKSGFPRLPDLRAPGAAAALVASGCLIFAACTPASSPSPSARATTDTGSATASPAGTSSPTTDATASPDATASESASPGASGAPSGCTIVASDLLNPRGISFGADGTLYIAEAGQGGEEPDFPTTPASSPGASPDASPDGSPETSPDASPADESPAAESPAAESPATSPDTASPDASPGASQAPVTSHGDTGRVSMVTPDGTQEVLVDGLTSYFFGTEVVGPADVVAADDGTVYVSIGGPGPGVAFFTPQGYANSVVSVDTAGTVTPVANIGEYEVTNNPDPYNVDSNVGGIALGTDGLLYVADSGGNTLYSFDPAAGALELVTVFPGLPTPDGSTNPARGDLAEVDPVPTDVTADPNGGVLVGYLTGAQLWAEPGSASVVSVAEDGTLTEAVTGVSMVTGVAESGGAIYLSEFSTDFSATPPAPGDVASATVGGSATSVLSDLPTPYGVAVGSDGMLYVAVNSSVPAESPAGQVLACDVGAAPAASPGASPEATDVLESPEGTDDLESPEATDSPESPEATDELESPEATDAVETPEVESPDVESPEPTD